MPFCYLRYSRIISETSQKNIALNCDVTLPLRARYLALLVTGENHPELALIDSNIGLILHAVGEYDISLRFLEKALALNIAYHGPRLLPL